MSEIDKGAPAGTELEELEATFVKGQKLQMWSHSAWGGSGWTISYKRHKGQHMRKQQQWYFTSYMAAKVRFGVLCERLGRGLGIGDEVSE